MGNIRYTAVDRGELIGGNIDGVQYNFDFILSGVNESPKEKINTSRSLGGKAQSTLYSTDIIWNVSSEAIAKDSVQWQNFREFLSSVRAGEFYTLDVFGTIAVPVDPLVMIKSGPPSYLNTSANFYTISFQSIYSENL